MIDQILGWADTGGPIVIILALLSVYSLALIAVKAMQMAGTLSGRAARDQAIEAWRAGDREAAQRGVAGGRSPADRVLAAVMAGFASRVGEAALREDAERLGNSELEALGRNIRTLETVATVSPLLGLLGTVLGMIQSFQELELAQGSANAAVLAGGIWQALLTTAAGLIVAIPAAIAASVLTSRIDRTGHLIEDAVARIFAAEKARGGR